MASADFSYDSNQIQFEPLIRLWMLRILAPLGGYRVFMLSSDGLRQNVLATIGLEKWVSSQDGGFTLDVAITELRRLHQQEEAAWADAPPPAPAIVRRNVEKIAALVGLSFTDCRLLEFVVLLRSERLLDSASESLGMVAPSKTPYLLSVILGLPESEIRAALHFNALLPRSGLMTLDRERLSQDLSGRFKLLPGGFVDRMSDSDNDPINLLRGTVYAVEAAQLSLADYSHIQELLAVLCPYLRHALSTGRCGVNIFLHGVPGTGKTQLARVLAEELGCQLFEVASEDEDGDINDGEARLQAFRAAQSFFGQKKALIVFDEVEDIFNDGGGRSERKSTAQTCKAWINRILEENTIPTLWLSNSIRGLDPAFVRRFDMVFELPVPPKKQRERILQQSCGDILDAASQSRIAKSEHLAPAVAAKAGSVIRAIHQELGPQESARALERLLSSTLEAQGHDPLLPDDPNQLPEIYDPGFIHADADLAQVAQGLQTERAARLCLYGPSGTGKTAYGRWLATQLDMPLLVKRASDLMSMWVGGNEKNIAGVFRQATQEGALLLIDEVDSFLQDRQGAQRSWEISMVNEMLTQMEAFSGLFIASTNLMAGLDSAALRRFDLKVKFDFLRPEQVGALLSRYCTQLNLPEPGPELQPRIMRQQQLTPGDFAAVVRQHRFRPITTAAQLLAALEAEAALKAPSKTSIGFV